jgi:hypothetical protein
MKILRFILGLDQQNQSVGQLKFDTIPLLFLRLSLRFIAHGGDVNFSCPPNLSNPKLFLPPIIVTPTTINQAGKVVNNFGPCQIPSITQAKTTYNVVH